MAPLKFSCTVAPAVELTFAAESAVVLAEKPVPETATEVAEVNPEPLTMIDCCAVVLAAQVPKSTIDPDAGEVNTPEDEAA